jgi:hypothetical protein
VGLPHACVRPSECYRAGTTQDHPEIRSGENVHQREFTDLRYVSPNAATSPRVHRTLRLKTTSTLDRRLFP